MLTHPLTPHTDAARPTLRWLLASLSLAMLLSSLGTSIANVGLPTLAQAFGAGFAQVQWVVLAYLLAMTTLIVGVGRLGDRVGPRRLLLAGIALFTLASVLCGLAPTLGWLIAARALQGLGAAAMMALALAMVGATVPQASTGSAMGLLGTMSAVGTALGPTLGGALIAASGWRAIFFVNLPLGLLALALVLRYLPPDRPRASAPAFDKLGALLLALTLGAYALAMTSGRGLWLAVAALGAILFVRAERRAVAPLLRLSMFADRLLGAGFAMSALVSTVVMATLVVGPFYLSGALALDAAQVGLVMSSGPIVAALTGVPAGRWVDRWGAHRVTRAGLLAMAGGTALLPWMPLAWGVAGYIAPLLVVTAGYASFQAANNTAVMVSQPADRRGLVSGLLSLSRNLGLITGASVMGSLYALGSDATAGLRLSFGVATLLVGVAIVVALAVRPRPESAP